MKSAVWGKGRSGGNAATPVGATLSTTAPSAGPDISPSMALLERAFAKVSQLRVATMGDPAIAEQAAALRLVAAAEEDGAEDGKCPNCGSDCEQPLDCRICGNPCCPDCAPNGICDKCRAQDEDDDEDPAATLTPASSVFLAEAMAPAPAAAPVIPAAALPAVAAPVPAFSATAEIARLQAAIPGTPCSKERYRMQEHIEALESGKSSKPFLHQNQIDERQRVLSLEQGNATTSAEKWRIGNQIEQLGQGIDPGPFVPAQLIAASVAALEADLATETDSAAVWEILAHIDAVKGGVPFVSREEKARRRAELEVKLEASTSNKERWNLVEELAAL